MEILYPDCCLNAVYKKLSRIRIYHQGLYQVEKLFDYSFPPFLSSSPPRLVMDGSPPISTTTVPFLLGIALNWSLFSVLCVQVFLYVTFAPTRNVPASDDSEPEPRRRWPLYLVSWICMAEITQTVLISIDSFRMFGTYWGDLRVFTSAGFTGISVPVMTGIISFTVQLFFAWRLYASSGFMWIAIIVSVICVVQLSASCIAGGTFYHLSSIGHAFARESSQTAALLMMVTTHIWLIGSAICDLIISTSMIVLYCQKRKLEAHSLPSTILQFFCFIIETALLCSSLAVVELALFVKYNQYAYFAVVAVPMSKIYSNSLMVILNSQAFILAPQRRSTVPSYSLFDTPSMVDRLRTMPLVDRNSQPIQLDVFEAALARGNTKEECPRQI